MGLSLRTPTAPPTDKVMWRKLLARCHPDGHGDHEPFIWVRELHEHVAVEVAETSREVEHGAPASRHREDPDRVLFDSDLGYVDEFVNLTHRAISIGKRTEEPYRAGLRGTHKSGIRSA